MSEKEHGLGVEVVKLAKTYIGRHDVNLISE